MEAATPVVASGSHIGHWTAERVGNKFWEDRDHAIGLVRNGQIVAGVIYESFNGKSVIAHIAVEGRLTRFFLWAIFDYPYRVCGVSTIICPVVVSNARSVRLVEHMGFKTAATLTDCHPDGDLRLYTLRRADCRFLEGSYVGQKSSRRAAAA